MRHTGNKNGYKLWLSESDTELWANGGISYRNHRWPYSTLRGKKVFVEIGRDGIVDANEVARNADRGELQAIIEDFLPAEYRYLWPVWRFAQAKTLNEDKTK